MPGTKLVHINRHDTATANAYVGVEGEVTMDTSTRELRTHDGVAAGGQRILTKTQNDLTYQPLAADLTALAGFGASTGIIVHAALNTSVLRTLTAPAAGITVTNPGGVAGNPTFVLANDLAALEGLAGTGFGVRTTTDTWANRSLAAPASGLTITNPDGVSGNPTFALANDLGALEALAGTGIAVRSGADTWVQRSITQPAAGITITNNDGVAGNPTLALANDLGAVEGLATTGLAARTAADTWTTRSLTAPAAGLTITNNDAVAGNPTFALANDLAAVEGLAGTGIAVRTASDTWAQRTITSTGLTVTNPGGVAGNIDITMPNTGPGAGLVKTPASLTLDAQGRVAALGIAGLAIGQVVFTAFNTVVTTAGTILPIDNTIPQSGEGDQLMTQAITPKSAASLLLIEITLNWTTTAGALTGAALFQDAGTGAIAAWFLNAPSGSGFPQCNRLSFIMVAGTTSATTFKLRAGTNPGNVITMNGNGGVQVFGGVMASSISITEFYQ